MARATSSRDAPRMVGMPSASRAIVTGADSPATLQRAVELRQAGPQLRSSPEARGNAEDEDEAERNQRGPNQARHVRGS